MSEFDSLLPEPDGSHELVLPSGRFAHMRSITMADRLAVGDRRGYALIYSMAIRTVTIDGEPLVLEELLAMDDREGTPLVMMVAEQMVEGAAAKGVA